MGLRLRAPAVVPAAADAVLAAFDRQVAWCSQPSPFSARVLQRSRLWLQQPAAPQSQALAALCQLGPDPLAAAVPLRWLAALHLLALEGRAPWAAVWPSTAAVGLPVSGLPVSVLPVSVLPANGQLANGQPADGPPSDATLDAAINEAWRSQQASLRAALRLPPQTNEVQRSAALLPGLLHVVAHTGLPLALLEIGASAGLNLWCDHYQHDHGLWAWTQAGPALVLRSEWQGPPPPLSAALHIASRAACDAHPVDLEDPRQARRLASFIWADQADRLQRLRLALQVASAAMARTGVRVQTAGAADFLPLQLKQRRPGRALVLMHSVVWQYIGAAEQADIDAQMQAAGSQANANAPLAWLRFEPPQPDQPVQLRCRIWPDGSDHLLARCHPHGSHIEWLA